MEPLVLVAPLSVALSLLPGSWDGNGRYDETGLWWPFSVTSVPLCMASPARSITPQDRTSLRADAQPFIPKSLAPEHKDAKNPEVLIRTSHADSLVQRKESQAKRMPCFLRLDDWLPIRAVSRSHACLAPSRFQEVSIHASWDRPPEIEDEYADSEDDSSQPPLWHAAGTTEEPKIPPSAYQLFVQHTRPGIAGSPQEVAKLLSTSWSCMPAHDKAPYEDRARQLYDNSARHLTGGHKQQERPRSTAGRHLRERKRRREISIQTEGIGTPGGTSDAELHQHGGVSLQSQSRFTGYHLFVIQIHDGLSGSWSEVADQILELWDALDPEEKVEYEQIVSYLNDVELEDARTEYDHAISERGNWDDNNVDHDDGDSTQKEEDTE